MLQYMKTLEKEITALQKKRNKLVESGQLFRTLTEKSFAGLYVVQDGRFRFLNANAACFAGYKPRNLVGKKSDIILHPEDRKKVKREAQAMLQGKSNSPHEFRIITKNGSIRWILETVASITYEGRGAILGNSMDITDHKLAEEALKESERRLAEIVDFLPDPTLAIDQDKRIIVWNKAMEELTGIPSAEMIGGGHYAYSVPFYGEPRPQLMDLFWEPEHEIAAKYPILRKEGDNLVIEVFCPALYSGRGAHVWAKATPLFDTDGNLVGAIEAIRDITERKRAEEDLKRREKELELKNVQLEDLNAALRVLLKQRDEDKTELEEKVLANVKKLVMPYVEKLHAEPIGSKAASYLGALESNLKDIVSPFARKLSVKYVDLTHREVQIAALIKEGRTTKDIAEMLNISESAINIHRYNIRRKLGLTKKHNLHAYLTSLA